LTLQQQLNFTHTSSNSPLKADAFRLRRKAMPTGWPASQRHQNDLPEPADDVVQKIDTANVVLNPQTPVVAKAPRSFREQIFDNQFLTAVSPFSTSCMTNINNC